MTAVDAETLGVEDETPTDADELATAAGDSGEALQDTEAGDGTREASAEIALEPTPLADPEAMLAEDQGQVALAQWSYDLSPKQQVTPRNPDPGDLRVASAAGTALPAGVAPAAPAGIVAPPASNTPLDSQNEDARNCDRPHPTTCRCNSTNWRSPSRKRFANRHRSGSWVRFKGRAWR